MTINRHTMFTRIFGAAALLLALVIITYAPQAQALSCIQPEPVATFVQNGGVVFIGSTAKNTSVGTAFENDQSVDKRKVLFNVEHAWSTNQITSPFTLFDYVPPIANDKDIWGFSKTFEVGKKYVIYARYENGEYRADIGGCARSHEFQGGNVQAGISESLGAGYTPTGEAVTPTTDGGDDSFVNGLLAQIQSLLALVAD